MNKQSSDVIAYLELKDYIRYLDLDLNTYCTLRTNGINTINDLLSYGENLRKLRNIGDKRYQEIVKKVKEKCNISMEKDVSELKSLNLSTRTFNLLISKYNVSTIQELLSISLDKRTYYHLDKSSKFGKEIIDKIHSMGLKFKDEEEKQITIKDKVSVLKINNTRFDNLNMTIEELLKLSLNKDDKNSIYKLPRVGEETAKKIINIIHSYGFIFESEKEENIQIEEMTEKKQLTPEDSIYSLGYYPGLTRNMKYYGIKTIEDLLKLSTDEQISYKERGIYNIKGFGKDRVKLLIDYVHSLGFVFEDEKATLEKNNTLENLYRSLNPEFISKEFYEKIESPEDFGENSFVLYFTKMAKSMCKNEFDSTYTNKEIISFLLNKLTNHKKQMLMITNNISKSLELKKTNK